jgi:hypothetical protein
VDCFPVFLDLVKYQGFDYAFTGWGWISEPDPAEVCVCVHDVPHTINIGDCSGPTATEQSTWGTVKGLLAVSVGAHEP